MKIFLPLMVVGILVLSGLGASVGTIDNKEAEPYVVNDPTTVSLDDELDQYQTEVEDGIPVGNFEVSGMPRYNWSVAQSFVPTKEVLTRVSLLLARNTTPPTVYPIIVAIRNSLTGDNLACISVEPQEIEEFPNYSWVEFDFDDLIVSVNQIYYIVSYTKNVTDNAYVWGVNGCDLYPSGQVFFSFDDGVHWDGGPPLNLADMCFKTYGIDTSPPNKPSITGPTSGKAGTEYDYTFSATDPDADNIYYFVNWGCCDDGDFHEYGPYESGEEVTLSHTWSEQGDYVIEAYTKDINGAESDIAKLEISMPKSKTINNKGLFEDGNMGFMLVIGDFTEEETRYTGHFSFMLFIGFVDGEFKFYTVHDEMMILEKSLIQKEILITSKIIIVIVAE